MSWEQTDFSIAAKADRGEELRAQGDHSRLVKAVIRERREARRATVSALALRPIRIGRRALSRLFTVVGGVFESMAAAIHPAEVPSLEGASHD